MMKHIVPLAGLVCAALAPDAPAVAQYAPAPYRLASTVEDARQVIESRVASHPAAGLAIAVMVDGQLLWSEGFGFADLEQRVPMWPTSKVRIGSVSKPMTAAAAMRLWDRGQLDIDAPVQQYVPYFPEKRWRVTTRQLGGHLAGIRHYREGEFFMRESYATVEAGIDIFAADTLMHEPGTRYLYSSYGWNLISAVVEGASRMSFLEAMRTEVFRPLGLVHTVADHPDSLITQRVRFYEDNRQGEFVNAPYVDNSYKWAGGGFLSSVEDMVRFGHAHLDDSYLSAAARDLLFSSQATSDGIATGYGFGWQIQEHEGMPFFSHGGGSVGGSTFLTAQPDTRLVVAIHVNQSGYGVAAVAVQIAVLFATALAD